MQNKRGLSPIIATLMLILIAVILAALIFWWVRQFVQEGVTKNIGGGDEPISNFCSQVEFTADASVSGGILSLTIENTGQVPIYGLEVEKQGFASTTVLGEEVDLESLGVTPGDTYKFSASDYGAGGIPSVGDNINLVPVLLGQGSSSEKAYPCTSTSGLTVKVS